MTETIIAAIIGAAIERTFILGTAIDTDSGNGFKTQRYVIESKTLLDINHTYEQDGLTFS